MTRKTTYEWVCELVQTYPDDPDIRDVIEPMHDDSYADVRGWGDTPEEILALNQDYDIALVRNVWDDVDGLIERDYAYVEDGVLEDFPDRPAPKRFHEEVRKHEEWIKEKQV